VCGFFFFFFLGGGGGGGGCLLYSLELVVQSNFHPSNLDVLFPPLERQGPYILFVYWMVSILPLSSSLKRHLLIRYYWDVTHSIL
jgi:hypothetical protein